MPLVVLTNYPSQTAQDLANRFAAAGLEVPRARSIPRRWPPPISCAAGKAKAYVVGEGPDP